MKLRIKLLPVFLLSSWFFTGVTSIDASVADCNLFSEDICIFNAKGSNSPFNVDKFLQMKYASHNNDINEEFQQSQLCAE